MTEKIKKKITVPEDSASSEDKVEFMRDFNTLLCQRKRFVRLCDVSKLFRGRVAEIYFEN